MKKLYSLESYAQDNVDPRFSNAPTVQEKDLSLFFRRFFCSILLQPFYKTYFYVKNKKTLCKNVT